MWGIGLVIPTEHIEDIVKFGDKIYIIEGGIYDGKISKWYATNGIHQYYTLPSLVNHRNHAESNKSLIGHGNGRGRVARFWIGEENSALSINWDTIKMKVEV